MEKINLKKQAELISEIDAMIFELYKHPFDSIEELEQSFSTSRKMIDRIVDTYDLENTSIKISISRFESCYNIKKSRIQDTLENNKKLDAKQSKQEEKMRQKEDKLNKIQQRKMEKEEAKKEKYNEKLKKELNKKTAHKTRKIKIFSNSLKSKSTLALVKTGVVTAATAVVLTSTSCFGSAKTIPEEVPVAIEQPIDIQPKEEVKPVVYEMKKVPYNLYFDIQDNTNLKNAIVYYVKDSMAKGIEYNEENLRTQIRGLINTYYMTHLDQFDMQYITNLYWNSSQTTKTIFDDAMAQKNMRATDSITSSVEDGTMLDFTTLNADKIGSSFEKEMRLYNATIFDALRKGDQETINSATKKISDFLQSIKTTRPTTSLFYYAMALRDAKTMKEHFTSIGYDASAKAILPDGTEESLFYGISACDSYDDVVLLKPNNGILSYNEQIMLSLYEQLEQKFSLMPMYAQNVPENNQNIDALVDSICMELLKNKEVFNTYVANGNFKALFASKQTKAKSGTKKAIATGVTTTTTTTKTIDASEMTPEQKAQADQEANLKSYIVINGVVITSSNEKAISDAEFQAKSDGSELAMQDIDGGYKRDTNELKDYYSDFFDVGYVYLDGYEWDNSVQNRISRAFRNAYNKVWNDYEKRVNAAKKWNSKQTGEYQPTDEKTVNTTITETGKLPNSDLDKENQKEQNQGNNSGTGSTEQDNTNSESEPTNNDKTNEPTNNDKTNEPTNNGSETSAEIGSSYEEVIGNGSVTSNTASDHEISQGAESSVREALDSAGQSDVELNVETKTGPNLSFNTFRQSFLNQLRDLRNMIVPQNNMEHSMYCSNQTKTEAASYVKTLQKIEPVVSSNRLS